MFCMTTGRASSDSAPHSMISLFHSAGLLAIALFASDGAGKREASLGGGRIGAGDRSDAVFVEVVDDRSATSDFPSSAVLPEPAPQAITFAHSRECVGEHFPGRLATGRESGGLFGRGPPSGECAIAV